MTQASRRFLLFVFFCFTALPSPIVAARNQAGTKPTPEETKGFETFSASVQLYVKIHNRAEKALPKLKDTASPGSIADHQRALAEKIRQARGSVRPGNVFTPDVAAAFRQAIKQEFQSSHAKNALATIQQGEPVKNVHLEVDQIYPKTLPYTSVPPTLLLKLPKLPNEVAYRIVDRDLVLLDVQANLVVDVLPKALPST